MVRFFDNRSLKAGVSFFNNFLEKNLTKPIITDNLLLTLNINESSLLVFKKNNECERIKILKDNSNFGSIKLGKNNIAVALDNKLFIFTKNFEKTAEYEFKTNISNIVKIKDKFYFRTGQSIWAANEKEIQEIYTLEKTGLMNSKFTEILRYKSRIIFIDGQSLIILSTQTGKKVTFDFPLQFHEKIFFLENQPELVGNKIILRQRYKIFSINLDNNYKMKLRFFNKETSSLIVKANYNNIYGNAFFIKKGILFLLGSYGIQCYNIKTKAIVTFKNPICLDKPQWICIFDGKIWVCDKCGNIFNFTK